MSKGKFDIHWETSPVFYLLACRCLNNLSIGFLRFINTFRNSIGLYNSDQDLGISAIWGYE